MHASIQEVLLITLRRNATMYNPTHIYLRIQNMAGLLLLPGYFAWRVWYFFLPAGTSGKIMDDNNVPRMDAAHHWS